MFYKSLIFFLILTFQFVCAQDVEYSLPNLNYELVESLNPMDGEPSKYYQLFISPQAQASQGVLMIRKMNGEFVNQHVFIEADGTIWAQNKTKGRRINFGGGYGEKLQLLLAAVKSKIDAEPLAKCEFVPFPLFVNDDKGHKIEVIADTSDGKHFTVMGSGFRPKEIISFNSCSSHERLENSFAANDQGTFEFGYSPAVLGEVEGPFQLTFCGENMKPLILHHYWGKIAFYRASRYKALAAKYPFPDE